MKNQAIQYLAFDVHQVTTVATVRDEHGAIRPFGPPCGSVTAVADRFVVASPIFPVCTFTAADSRPFAGPALPRLARRNALRRAAGE